VPSNLNDLTLQVAAMTTFDELDLTDEQLTALKKLAANAAGTIIPPLPATRPVAAEYPGVLTQLRTAFLKRDGNAITPFLV
jgi:hypothetical protein